MRTRWPIASSGSITAEMVVLTPLVVLLALFVVAFGRLELASSQLDDAVRAAAQAAVIWPTTQQAQQAAAETASFTLNRDGITCSPYDVETDSSNWHTGGSVSITLTCTVSLSQVAIPGLPGSHSITAHATAPIESFRGLGQ